MGRATYYVEGSGMTVEEARRHALAADRDMHGTEEGYSGGFNSSTGDDDRVKCLRQPVPAKKALLTRAPKGVPLKWETRYVAEIHAFEGDRQVVSEKTMGACIAKAREYSRAHNVRLALGIEKIAVQGTTRFGEVTPQKGVDGLWAFSGEARM